MSIRQMSFEEGQALNIRECQRIPSKNTTIDELKDYAVREDMLVVKSGTSYFDVTAKPEIFEAAHEFDIDSLTNMDRRDLKQTELEPAFSSENNADADPMAALFRNTSQDEEEEYEEYERKTYYLRSVQVEALRLLCFHEHKDVSEMVRELLDTAITEYGKRHFEDIYAEAEKNLQNKPKKIRRKKKKNTV